MTTPGPTNPLERRSLQFPNLRFEPWLFQVSLTLDLLQSWFASGEPGEEYLFSHEGDSQITICDQQAFLQDDTSRTPTIVVQRGAQRFKRGDGLGKLAKLDLKTGARTRMGVAAGAVTIHCFGEGNSMEADYLAGRVYEFFQLLDDRLRTYGFFSIESVDLGVEGAYAATGDVMLLRVPVTVVASWQRVWATREKAPTIARDLNLIVNGGR